MHNIINFEIRFCCYEFALRKIRLEFDIRHFLSHIYVTEISRLPKIPKLALLNKDAEKSRKLRILGAPSRMPYGKKQD